MTDDDKALKWLDVAITFAESQRLDTSESDKHRAAIKRMLAEPRMSKEASLDFIRKMFPDWPLVLDVVREYHRGLYADLTAPKTKTVWEVTVIEADVGAQVGSISEALRSADCLLKGGRTTVTICKREVPA